MAKKTDTEIQSDISRYGNRYYRQEEGYDKRVYENEPINYVKIIGMLILVWAFNALHWWACLEFGIYDTEGYTIYSIIIFVITVLFIAWMLVSGAASNRTKREYEFLKGQIAELKAEAAEEREKKKQEEEYAAKMEAARRAKEDAKS